jgi:2'-5' RNA ligase/GNAT superfamily N-acetyltransferase
VTYYAFSPRKVVTATDWFHGTGNPKPFSRFDFSKSRGEFDPDQGETRQWNSRLGSHFSTEHQVASEIARSDGGGHVYHADLDMKNPKHYGSEFDLGKEAHQWARKHQGYSYAELGMPHANRSAWSDALNEHPHAQDIADGFRSHLQSQGHDGITYGNEYEGTQGHKSAIIFHPDQANITHTHRAYDGCDQATPCEHCGEPIHHGEDACPECHEPSGLGATAFFRQASEPQEWFHGTSNSTPTTHFDFDKERGYQDETGLPRYWNSHLGAHFTSVHSVAKDVAREWSHRGGHITHAHLDMANPKHYGTEDDMDHEAYNWAEKNGYDPMAHRDKNELHGLGGLLTVHPQAREIAHGFRDHLKTQGHDSVTYGNTIEGPYAHKCAIAFHPDQIHVTGTHGVNEPCPPGGHTATAFLREAGQSGELPEGLSFKYYGPGHFPSVGNRPFHCLVAHHPDAPDKAWPNQAGHLVWWGPDGGIDSVHVQPDFRRRGVATELWNRAKEMEPRLHHSTLQTEDGKAWAPHVSSKHTATAFFAQAATDGYNPTTQKEGEHGTNEPRRSAGDPAPRGHAERPAAGQPEPASLHRREATAEGVERHPELQGDLDRLGGGARHVQSTIDALHQGGSGVTTYPLSHPLEGWHAALTGGGHQVVHRHDPETGSLHVGYAGHNISDAEQRLGGASEGSKALPVDFHGGAEKDFDKLHPETQDKALDTIDRLSRGEVHQHDHSLHGVMSDWRSARVDFLNRVTHRYEDEDGNPTSHEKASRLFVGHVGPHNYEAAEKRLSATAYFKQAYEGDTPYGTLARGMNVALPADKHSFIHDERQPLPARAHMLLSELKKPTDSISNEELKGSSGGLGEFWTRNHLVSDDAALTQHEERPAGQRSTNVTLHAHEPGGEHFWSEMSGGHGDYEGNWRVPLHPGTPLGVHAITWGEPGGTQHHYNFSHPVDKHAVQAVSTMRQTAGVDDDGKMMHRAPGPNHAPLHDPTHPSGEGGAFNQEDLDNPDWGSIGEPHEESLAAVRRAKGNPDAPVTIYRSVPHGVSHIRTGDWVSTSSQYAHEHGMHPTDASQDWPVLKATVPAKHVHTDGNDINEWGYNGPHIEHPAVHGPDEEWTEPHEHTPHHATFQQALLAEAAAVDNSTGVMVALVPPREIAEQLAMKDGQPVDDLHVTLAYLGKTSDYTPEQLKLLPQIVSSWALRQKPVDIRIGGTGKFNSSHKGQHVLYAAVDIPGGAQMHADLARYLQGHGYELPSEHGWTPHLTLAYVDRHFRFMPHLDEHRWTADQVVTEVGTTRHQARLGTIPSGRHQL